MAYSNPWGKVMDAIDKYIEAFNNPVVRSYWRKINLQGEEEPGPHDGVRASQEQVAIAERALGVALPPSYRKLVTTTEPYDNVWGLYWVNDSNSFGADIVSTYQSPNSPLPPFLIPVQWTNEGDEYCFDTRHPDQRGEYPIVFFNHETDDKNSTDFETVAKDLGEFLLGSLGGETPS